MEMLFRIAKVCKQVVSFLRSVCAQSGKTGFRWMEQFAKSKQFAASALVFTTLATGYYVEGFWEGFKLAYNAADMYGIWHVGAFFTVALLSGLLYLIWVLQRAALFFAKRL